MDSATLNQASSPPANERAAEEVQWTWKREGRHLRRAKLQLGSRRVIVEQIAEELKLIGDGGVYHDFLNSCFGFLMRFDTQGVACNGALHCLFAREVVKADASSDELWYRVGGRLIRFSKYEYALITGLSFGPSTFDPSAKHHPPENGLFLRHYQGQNLTMDALQRDFTNGVFRESPADALKMAKLLIVYFLLFGMNEKKKYIDEWAWTLIEDTNRWETFPWGNYTYQILLEYIRQLPTELTHSVPPSYHVYGYVWAFLTWAFEAIPEFGLTCGVLTCEDVLPRCLRWKYRSTAHGLDMGGFLDGQIEVQSTLEPSAEEQRQPYWEHIHDDLRSGVCYTLPPNNPLKKTRRSVNSLKKTRRSVNPLKKTRRSVNSSVVCALPASRPQRFRATSTLNPCHTSAAPMIRKRKRSDTLITRAPRKIARQEKTIQKEVLRIVRQELPSVIRQELPSVIRQEVHLALKELLYQRDTSDDLHTTTPDTVDVQCDEAEIGGPVVPRGFEKHKCVDTMVVKMGTEIHDLRHEKLAAINTIEELRLKLSEADKVLEELKLKKHEYNQTVDESGNGSRCSELSKKGKIVMELNGLSDEASTEDSEDDSCTDSKMDDLVASLPSKKLGRKWTCEVDLFRALQQDEELCLDAVCALYRQHIVARKSKGHSNNGVFDPVDSMSGCALAEYLIGGDGELRLSKSVSEVKIERPDVIGQCRKLATFYVEKLFAMYCAANDPFFGQS
ncbi:hypothetical protein CASFOL_010906 [Castilleja foliolosa]|uniref:DUF1985 domain-containing protein n=1 Tax=Castilleja foliolosa TaxID=1961234 RepID=A0ABD3DTY3_9LAMI